MDNKFQNILNSKYSPNTWWMLAGDAIYGKILILGDILDDDLEVINVLAKSVEQYGDACLEKYLSQNTDSGSEIFDLIIIYNIDNKEFTDRILSNIRSQYKTENAQVLICEKNFYKWNTFSLNPIYLIKSFIYDLRKIEIQSYFKGNAISKWGSFTDRGVPYESYPTNIYYNNKNTFSLHEKIKKIIFNTPISRIFFNSFIWSVSKNNKENNFITSCINALNRSDSTLFSGANFSLVKMQYKVGKLILSFSTDGNREPKFILVFPLDRNCYNQRINEKEIIKKVSEITEINHLFVNQIIKSKVCGFPYFGMKEFHGVTVDIKNPLFAVMTSNGFNIIKKIPKCDSSMELNGNEVAKTIAFQYFDLLELKYAQFADRILTLRKLFFKDNCMILVKMFHGDLKLENFVFDPKSGKVIGIIDLELSQIPGPALLDLYYLITYNYQSIYKQKFSVVFLNLINETIETDYLNYIHDYCLSYGISNEYKKIYLVLFFVHHYARRFSFSVTNDYENTQFSNCLELSIRLLESKS